MTDDVLERLQVGCFVAVYLENYDKAPAIGNVVSVEEDNFQIHYWKGSYQGK